MSPKINSKYADVMKIYRHNFYIYSALHQEFLKARHIRDGGKTYQKNGKVNSANSYRRIVTLTEHSVFLPIFMIETPHFQSIFTLFQSIFTLFQSIFTLFSSLIHGMVKLFFLWEKTCHLSVFLIRALPAL